MVLYLRHSKMVSFFLSTIFSVTLVFLSKTFRSVLIANVSIFNFYSPECPQGTNLKIYYKAHYCCIFFRSYFPKCMAWNTEKLVATSSYSFGEPSTRAWRFIFESADNYFRELAKKTKFQKWIWEFWNTQILCLQLKKCLFS